MSKGVTMKIKRNYKDSTFRKLFNDKERLIELYNALSGSNYSKDTEIYPKHGEAITREYVESGIGQDYLIYGHEHRTEETTGDDVGTVQMTNIDGTMFVNLPSSGCVHGRKTSYVSIRFEDTDEKTELKPVINAIEYDRDKLEQVLIETCNPKPHFFGGIKGKTGGENLGR
jgi:hypothetical protein